MWLLDPIVLQAMADAIHAGFTPTAEQLATLEARAGDGAGGERVLRVAGDTAEVMVSGVITAAPAFMAMLFGGGNTTYPEIVAALASAEADPAIKHIDMVVDSPGGQLDGLFDAIAAAQSSSKLRRARVRNKATSAAYALASQAPEIVAENKASRVGSIGVVAGFPSREGRVEITSTLAPKKRPDVNTDAGRADVREEIDAYHHLFVEAIAEGRGTTADVVNAEYGQGRVYVASEAMAHGMIDSVAGAPPRVVKSKATKKSTTATGGDKLETRPMDLNTLRAQHPDVFAAAKQEGVLAERDRASAHLAAGTSSGLMADAVKAVEEGTEMTTTLQTKYMMAAANRGDLTLRAADDAATAAAAAAPTAAPAPTEQDAAAAQVMALVEGNLGLDAGAGSHE